MTVAVNIKSTPLDILTRKVNKLLSIAKHHSVKKNTANYNTLTFFNKAGKIILLIPNVNNDKRNLIIKIYLSIVRLVFPELYKYIRAQNIYGEDQKIHHRNKKFNKTRNTYYYRYVEPDKIIEKHMKYTKYYPLIKSYDKILDIVEYVKFNSNILIDTSVDINIYGRQPCILNIIRILKLIDIFQIKESDLQTISFNDGKYEMKLVTHIEELKYRFLIMYYDIHSELIDELKRYIPNTINENLFSFYLNHTPCLADEDYKYVKFDMYKFYTNIRLEKTTNYCFFDSLKSI
jgi:hypothetical protein